MKKTFMLLAALVSLPAMAAGGDALFVDNQQGDDAFDGLFKKPVAGTKHGPFKTIGKAFATVEASGKICIANTGIPYKEQCVLSKGGGSPAAPTIVEGNGATISGLDAIPPEKWKAAGSDIYETDFHPMSNLLKIRKDFNCWIGEPQIWWIDGKPGVNCKTALELESVENGFLWDKRNKKALVHLPKGRGIDEVTIEMPVRGTSVSVNTDYVVVKDLKSMFSWDDGFDTHKNAKGAVFKNCIAIGNCGQAFSSHNYCGAIYEDCAGQGCASSGSCDVNSSVTIYRNCVFLNNAFEAGVHATENAKVTFESCIIAGNGPFEQIWQIGNSSISLFNCVVAGKAGNKSPALKLERGALFMNQCTVVDVSCLAEIDGNFKGSLKVSNCLIGRMDKPILKVACRTGQAPSLAFSDNAYFEAPGIECDGVLFNKGNWTEYQNANTWDRNSTWTEPELKGNLKSSPPEDSPLMRQGKLYNSSVRIGAELPKCVWTLYLDVLKMRGRPAGICERD